MTTPAPTRPRPRPRLAAAAAALTLAMALLAPGAAHAALAQPGARDVQFGYYYRWNPDTQAWDLHYGYHTSRYEVGPAPAGTPPAELPSAVPSTVLFGVAERLYRTELLPQQGDAAVVILRLADGSTRAVSLGRWDDLRGLDLRRGDELFVRGRPGLVGGDNVFMATEVQLGNERLNVVQPLLPAQDEGRPGRPMDRRRGAAPPAQRPRMQRAVFVPANTQMRADEMRTDRPAAEPPAFGDPPDVRVGSRAGELAGTVQELLYTNIPGVPGENVLVRLRLTGGPEHVVSLGSGLTPHQLERIERATRLQLRGRPASVNGRDVILADRISVDGYTFGVAQDPVFGGR